MLSFDVLVIGGGGGGMRAVLEAGKQKDTRVALMTKVFPTRSATVCAQGGISGALGNAHEADSPAVHALDTIKGSDYLGDQDAIEFFTEQAPACIRELDYLGVPFSRNASGQIAQREFGGATYPRACYSADNTGQVIVHTLYAQCLKNRITILDDWYLLEIITNDSAVCGVVAYNMKQGEIVAIAAKAVVIATGGYGRLYWSHTTNPFTSTGDGAAACFHAGIALKDPEFVQFHPTSLVATGILISEAARGEGGYLLNKDGERFMQRYAPAKLELATRDLICRAIETEIREGRGVSGPHGEHVLLDLCHLGRDQILEKLPQIRDLAITFDNVDLVEQPLAIRPVCHYTMGGIDVVDYQTCATAIPGIFAAGEAACVSIHGANRLGGNSLTDVIVFGKTAGAGAAAYARGQQPAEENQDLLSAGRLSWQTKFRQLTTRSAGTPLAGIRTKLAEVMWRQVGIFRSGHTLEQAAATIEELKEQYQTCAVPDTSLVYNTALVNYMELGNLLTLAGAVTLGALHRQESRGSHMREDFPNRDDDRFLQHTLVSKNGSTYILAYRPAVITTHPPTERSY